MYQTQTYIRVTFSKVVEYKQASPKDLPSKIDWYWYGYGYAWHCYRYWQLPSLYATFQCRRYHFFKKVGKKVCPEIKVQFSKLRQPTGQIFFPTFPKEFSHFLQTQGSHSKVHWENAKKKSGIMKSGLDAMPLFLLDDLLKTHSVTKNCSDS